MSSVKRVWKQEEEPVGLYLLQGSLGSLAIGWWCPGCGAHAETDADEDHMHLVCPCGQHVKVHLKATLEELEVEEVKGE